MTSPMTYLHQTVDELKKVVWPTKNDVIRLTILVIFVSLAVGLYIGGIDFMLTKLTESILR